MGHRDNRDRDRGAGWLPWVLGLLLLAGIIVALVLILGGNDEGTDTSESSATSSQVEEPATGTAANEAAGGSAAAAGGGAAESGVLTANGEAILPIPSQGLAPYSGSTVDGQSVAVESVVSDEGFWVGESSEDRVFVLLDIAGESPFQVTAGEAVSIQGTLEPLEGSPETVGVTDEEGSTDLESQGHYVLASNLEQG